MAIKTTIKHTFFDDSGNPLSGGKVYFYEPGTSTPKDTYTTSDAGTANANPVILNSRGEADIFTDGLYKVDLKTSANVQVTGYPVDNVGAGSSNNDATMRWCGTATGTANALTLSPTTSITAYAIGQSFIFKASASSNTAATTIAVSGLSAIAVQSSLAACAGGEIIASHLYVGVMNSLTTMQIKELDHSRDFHNSVRILTGTAIPAGGTAGAGYKFSTTSNFGIFFGSGAPTLAAAQGSLYLRSDGSSTTTRLYVNSNGSTTWVSVTTAS